MKSTVMTHRDGRTVTVDTPAEKVAAAYDGFVEGGAATSDTKPAKAGATESPAKNGAPA